MTEPPTLADDALEHIESWTEHAVDVRFISVYIHTAIYDEPALREQVRPLLGAAVEYSPRSFFTTGMEFDPPPPESEVPARVLGIAAKHASSEFEDGLREDGLQSVERTGEQDLRVPGRRTARAFQYDAGYPFDAGAVSDDGGTSAEGTAIIELPVRVWAAIWPTERSFEMAGGVYPMASLDETIREAGREPATDVEIEAQPGGDRRTVFDRIRSAAE